IMPTDKLEIEISKFVKDGGYSFSSEDDDKKRIYTIYSSELKQKLRKMIFLPGFSADANIRYKVENEQGDRILYKQDINFDQLTLISREATMPKEQEIDENEGRFAEAEKRMAEHEKRKTK